MTKNSRPSLSIAAIQMNSVADVSKNLASATSLIDSIDGPLDCIVLPEVFNYRKSSSKQSTHSETLSGPTVNWLKTISIKHNTHVIGGSIIEKTVGDKSYNTCVVINPKGETIATYRKINLFDAVVDNKHIRESDQFNAGKAPVMVDINGWKVGLSICYDLRFPELYRHYYKQGADIILVPSSFTYSTGEKHWHTLCRARAIENHCYVVAPNQIGVGNGGIKSYGHSLIINPMGEVMAEANDSDAMVISRIFEPSFKGHFTISQS